ncbi:MAG: FAD:protein FMN transferase [Aquabacterium sp.]|nr:FAD:protein FMN transferase [Aquabacterium sp.]
MNTLHPTTAAGVASPARRRMVIGLVATAAVQPLVVLPALAASTARVAPAGRALMGTWVTIELAQPQHPHADRTIAAAFDEMLRLERLLSHHDASSALSRLNRAAGQGPQVVPAELLGMLTLAQAAAVRTGGRFDPTVGRLTRGVDGLADGTVPAEALVHAARAHIGHARLRVDRARRQAAITDPATRLDLGGVAKLPILEAGLRVLHAHGLRGAIVNGGGDVLATARPDGRPWRIGVRDPAAPDDLLAVLPLHHGVVASSGDYERYVSHAGRRYHHIVDPATGRPSRGLHGVTLVADRVAEVNALGAAAMVAGPAHAGSMLAGCGVTQALLVGEDTRVHCTPALAAKLQPAPGRLSVRGLA